VSAPHPVPLCNTSSFTGRLIDFAAAASISCKPATASLVYNEISGRLLFVDADFFFGVERIPSHGIKGPSTGQYLKVSDQQACQAVAAAMNF
jgi:hypothetical protein